MPAASSSPMWRQSMQTKWSAPSRLNRARSPNTRGLLDEWWRTRPPHDLLERLADEPVSGREFPANRENNREFCKIGADRRLRRRKTRRYNNGLEANSVTGAKGRAR